MELEDGGKGSREQLPPSSSPLFFMKMTNG